MTNKEAIELLNSIKSEPVDYGELVGAPATYLGIHYVHIEPEDYAIDLAIKALEQQEKEKWVPISERFPSMEECQKNDCRFIVTDGNRIYQNWFNYIDGYFESYNCDGTEFSLLRKNNLVIAWKSMPEEYKGE